MINEKKPELEKFALRLKGLRERRRIKQKEMAELLGCATSHYQKIEYGRINISCIDLMFLADYFGVTTDYLLGRSEDGGPEKTAGDR